MKPFIVEFTGTPEAGKTTCINNVLEIFQENGIKTEYIQESAELLPSHIQKKTFEASFWMCNNTIEAIKTRLEINNSDIIFIDRGLCDASFYSYLYGNNFSSHELKKYNELVNDNLALSPNLLMVFTVDPKIAIHRRGGEGRIVTKDYVENYNMQLINYFKNHSNPKSTFVDTTTLKEEEVALNTLSIIQSKLIN